MKEILIVTESLGVDGPERVVSELSQKWYEDGNKVTILLTNSESHKQTYKVPTDIPIVKLTSEGIKPIKLLRDALEIRRILKLNSEIVGVSLMLSSSFSLAIAGVGLKNRIVLSERNDPHKVPFKWYQRKMRDLSLWLADVVVFQTEDARNYFCKKTRNKGELILNPVNPQLPLPFKGKRKREFVAVGRLAKQKNFSLLIRAFKTVSNLFDDYKLTIYGEGPERDELQKLIDSLELSEKVKMPGFSNNVYDRMVDSAAYISSSDYEGISNSMLEAMAMGMPVICTDCPIGGARQVIKDKYNGMLVPTGNENALAKAILEVIGNPGTTMRMAENAAGLRDKLNIDRISQQWLAVM